MTEYRFIEPLDVLFFRGNRLFGEGGAGDAIMPPMPSVVAGALRTRMLVSAGVDPARFGRGEATLPADLQPVLGTPEKPGTFTLTDLLPARRRADGVVEPLFPLPADLQVFADDSDAPEVRMLRPARPGPAVATGTGLAALPVLRRDAPGKPAGGYWLTAEGWRRYLSGEVPDGSVVVHQSALWKVERRLGIALDRGRRAAGDGMLYTTDAVSPVQKDTVTGLLVGVAGVKETQLPDDGLLRLGGDGRGAAVRPALKASLPVADSGDIARNGRFRVVLTTPGIFPAGWRLPGLDPEGNWSFPGGTARLITAAVPRPVTVSGWNLAGASRAGAPKTARRAAPVGAVYWFDNFRGEPEALGKLATAGLWGLAQDNDLPTRRAEGFNRFAVANA